MKDNVDLSGHWSSLIGFHWVIWRAPISWLPHAKDLTHKYHTFYVWQ
jgi:hypothetical protein